MSAGRDTIISDWLLSSNLDEFDSFVSSDFSGDHHHTRVIDADYQSLPDDPRMPATLRDLFTPPTPPTTVKAKRSSVSIVWLNRKPKSTTSTTSKSTNTTADKGTGLWSTLKRRSRSSFCSSPLTTSASMPALSASSEHAPPSSYRNSAIPILGDTAPRHRRRPSSDSATSYTTASSYSLPTPPLNTPPQNKSILCLTRDRSGSIGGESTHTRKSVKSMKSVKFVEAPVFVHVPEEDPESPPPSPAPARHSPSPAPAPMKKRSSRLAFWDRERQLPPLPAQISGPYRLGASGSASCPTLGVGSSSSLKEDGDKESLRSLRSVKSVSVKVKSWWGKVWRGLSGKAADR